SEEGRLLRGQGPPRVGSLLPPGRPVRARERTARVALDRRRRSRVAADGDPRRVLVRAQRSHDLRALAAPHLGAEPVLPRLRRGLGRRALPAREARPPAAAALMRPGGTRAGTVSGAVTEQGGEPGATGVGDGLPAHG